MKTKQELLKELSSLEKQKFENYIKKMWPRFERQVGNCYQYDGLFIEIIGANKADVDPYRKNCKFLVIEIISNERETSISENYTYSNLLPKHRISREKLYQKYQAARAFIDGHV